MSSSDELKGPDFAKGIDASTLREGEPLLGHAQGEAVVVVKRGSEMFAVGASCTHYGGPLGKGIVVGLLQSAHGRGAPRAGARRHSALGRGDARRPSLRHGKSE